MTRSGIEPARTPAGLARRLAAFCYDLLLLCALLFCLTLLLILLRGGRPIEPGTWWFDALLIASSFLFFGWFWTHGGQTLGMRAWRIRVEREAGGPVGWRQAALRYVGAWMALMPLGLGIWWGAFDGRRRCWHDMLSKTRVVQLPKIGINARG